MSGTYEPGPGDGGQVEITQASPLLRPDGSLMQVGWARQPLLHANLEDATTTRFRWMQRFRTKRWDYYGVTSPGGFFSITLADLGYAATAFVYTVDFERKTHHEETITIPLARGVTLARNSDRGDCRYTGRRAQVEFRVEGRDRIVAVHWDDFGGVPLDADLRFTLPDGHESTVVVIPIEGRRFYYNRKINAMPVEGTIRIGDAVTDVDPATSLGNLDWGRGVWEYESFWVWASASGFLPDGGAVGLNMGYGFVDASAATENTLLVDGRIHKLGTIDFDYTDTDFMRPWTMRSDRVDLVFTPFLERVASTNLLAVQSEVHQMFGRYNGTVVDDAGSAVQIVDLVGWAEEHHARW